MGSFSATFELRFNEVFEGQAELYVQPGGKGIEIVFADSDFGTLTLSLTRQDGEELVRSLSDYLYPE